MRPLILIGLISFCLACDKEKYFDGPDNYSDSFEFYPHADSMISYDDENWSFFQVTLGENKLSIDSTMSHSGQYALRCEASGSGNETLSKCSTSKQNMAFYEGETVQVTAWYYLSGYETLDWLFLMDLEEQATIGSGPGMRLALVDNCLLVEHKYDEPNIEQPENSKRIFPRNTWNKITFETKLSLKKEGYVKVYQNDTLIIEQFNWKTLPSDILYSQQGTRGMYSSIEIGATANPSSAALVLWVDDFSIHVIP